jgi:hypothetical protein
MNAPFQTSVVNEQCPFVVFLLSAAGIYVFTVSLLLKMGIGDSKGWGGGPKRRIFGPQAAVINGEWALEGVHWPGRGTHCIIENPNALFPPLPESSADEKTWFYYEMEVFHKLCALIRKREYELAEGPNAHDRDFYHKYVFEMHHDENWSRGTLEKMRHIVERLNIRCIHASKKEGNHFESSDPSNQVEWRTDDTGRIHFCIFHQLPELAQVVPDRHTPKDMALDAYFQRIRKLEYGAYLQYKQEHQNEHITLDDVHFAYDEAFKASIFKQQQKEWNHMWDAAHIYQLGDHLETLDNFEFGPSHAATHRRAGARRTRRVGGHERSLRNEQQMGRRAHYNIGPEDGYNFDASVVHL